MQYISPVRFGFEFFIRNEFEGNDDAKFVSSTGDVIKINPADQELNLNLNQLKTSFIMIGFTVLLALVSFCLIKIQTKRVLN